MKTSICSWKATVRVDLLVNTFFGGIGEGGYNSGGILGIGRASKQEGETQVTTLIFEDFLDLHKHGRL